ncbi:hypothetical protein pdam_00000515 [Pocillopora damicornis]|uniref:Uncharacterized protein n=1 Tax=Pocillopora damicornis TaxID=46731 RepID=A0A3M6TY35_POCDA|nr:hypothetical protein pdam_00000515 [Pocillopora damicornis]
MNYGDGSSIRGPDDTSSLDDIAISSLTTPLSSPISGIDKTRGEPVDTSDDETLDLLRRREFSRPLPYHLRGMELREQLRSTLATKRNSLSTHRSKIDNIFIKEPLFLYAEGDQYTELELSETQNT